jgi:hypothetical protein
MNEQEDRIEELDEFVAPIGWGDVVRKVLLIIIIWS